MVDMSYERWYLLGKVREKLSVLDQKLNILENTIIRLQQYYNLLDKTVREVESRQMMMARLTGRMPPDPSVVVAGVTLSLDEALGRLDDLSEVLQKARDTLTDIKYSRIFYSRRLQELTNTNERHAVNILKMLLEEIDKDIHRIDTVMLYGW